MQVDFSAFTIARTLTLERRTAHGARFFTEIGPIEVTLHAPGLFRLRFGDAIIQDYGLLAEPEPSIEAALREIPGGWAIAWGETVLELTAEPLRIALKRDGRTLVRSITDEHFRGWTRLPAFARGPEGWLASLALASGERIYGYGEKFGPLDRRGQLVTSRNEDALGVNTELSYKNCPFGWSPRGWGIFAHTPATVVSGVGYGQWSHRTLATLVRDEVMDLFLVAGDTPADLIERFTHLTGRPARPPVWSLGVWLSRAYYRTSDEALEAARETRARRMPCDVITLDGRAWLDTRTRFAFQWDPERYPDPPAVLKQLKEDGLRVCVWEYPYVSIHHPLFADLAAKGYLLKDRRTGEAYQYHWDPGPFGSVLTPLPTSGMLDFTHPDAYAWWRDQHEALFAAGVDVIKVDFGEQIPDEVVAFNGDEGPRLHNIYPLLYNRCVFEATAKFGRGEPVVWARSGWTGSQRYPVQWGGDPQTDWEGLAGSIRGGLSWGLTGVPYYASDVGGFYGARQPDPELYIRWVQAGIYGSHFRFHGIGVREPWGFGPEAEALVRDQLDWRMRLLPYLERCMDEASATAVPVMRAMALAFPDDPAAAAFDLQFLCGPALLVCPIIEPGGRVTVYLPAGTDWFDLASGVRHAGGRSLTLDCPIDRIPVFGKAGEVLPLGPAVQHTGQIESARRIDEVWIFGGEAQPMSGAVEVRWFV